MILELVKRLREIDDNLSLAINLSKDNVYTFSIDSNEIGSYLYSFSSTNVKECYDKIDNFIDCLEDNEKFCNLFEEILKQPFEVVTE